jgi:uncharacterized membrane protein YfcA
MIRFIILNLLIISAAGIKCTTNEQCETPDTGLACLNQICQSCNATNLTDPCGLMFGCKKEIDQDLYKCTRAPLFSTNTPTSTWFGAVLLFIGSALAAGGGLGGGGIFVPLLILVCLLSPKEAVPISQAMIFGGSIVNIYINYNSRHPVVKSRPLIDYDTVLILEPLMLLGTTVGVMLNAISPTWLIVVILVIIIGYGAVRTTTKGIRTFNAERKARKGEIELNKIAGDENINSKIRVATIMGNGVILTKGNEGDMMTIELDWKLANNAQVIMYTLSSNTTTIPTSEDNVTLSLTTRDPLKDTDVITNTDPEKRKKIDNIVERESKQIPRLLMIMGMFILIVILSLIRGGKAGAVSIVGIKTCSGEYWAVTVLLFIILIIIALIVGYILNSQYEEKVTCDYVFVDGDIEWTGRNVYLYPALSAFAGMCGGLLGIGGGMVMGPLLLELGMLPENTQATSATTVMITSGAAMFQFLFLGMLIPDYGLFFALLGFIATFFGQTFLNYLVKKYNTTSFIVFSIALVMIIAVILMAIAGIIRIVVEVESGGGGFSSLC